jgi:hypothetical protein
MAGLIDLIVPRNRLENSLRYMRVLGFAGSQRCMIARVDGSVLEFGQDGTLLKIRGMRVCLAAQIRHFLFLVLG